METLHISNRDLMTQAREALAGKWGLAVGTFFVYFLITIAISIPKGVTFFIISVLISGPLALGITLFSLALARNKEAKFEQIFDGFKHFERSLLAYVLFCVFVLLWALLLIVPGIIAAIAYSQTFFILADDSTISASDAIKKSKKMMYGYKWKYFCLGLRFVGWGLLCILTFGIGFLWLAPYSHVAMAKFYDSIKGASATETQSLAGA